MPSSVRTFSVTAAPRRNFWSQHFLVVAAFAFSCASVIGAPSFLKLPAFDGEVSGDFLMPQTGLEFHWQLTAESPPDEPAVRRGRLQVDGHGAHVVARATLDLTTGITSWKIEKATADLSEVFPAIAPQKLPDYAQLSVTGTVSAEGGGQLSPSGDTSGKLVLTIFDAAVRDFFGGWSAEGLDLRVEFPALPSFETSPVQHLTLRSFSRPAANIDIRDATTDFSFDSEKRIQFSNTKVAGYGGSVAVESFSLDTKNPEVTTRVHVESIDSQSLAAFLPGSIAEAHGRFSGELALHWSPATGVIPGAGKLSLIKEPNTSIRMSKTAGFFTSNMEPRLYFLPQSLGFLRSWVSLKNPAYATLKKIEEGEMPIVVDDISINFTPDGDEAGRSASVVIAARPSDPKSAVKNLNIKVNITGPITKVLQMGSANSVQIGF